VVVSRWLLAQRMDSESLTLLLRGQHINMPDRLERGLWPHPPLRFSDLVQHLAEILRRGTPFPRFWLAHKKGQVVVEGGVIEKHRDGYIYRSQRSAPLDPSALAETNERRFESAEAAASHYLRWDLHLPGDLDGWKVIR
jgi:hypothetical protein